jgi:TetR/AcrR family fatty acid metabolism transcriptional regulator
MEEELKEESKKAIEIIKAATLIFSKADFHKVTMDEIAEAANVGKGTLYRYYKNKEDLYFSIISKGLEALYRYITTTIEKEQDVISKIKKFVYCALRFFEKNKPFVIVFLQEEVKFREKGISECTKILDKITNLLEELILEGQKKGIIKENISASLSSIFLIGMTKSAFLESIESEIKIDLLNISDLISEVFCEGIVKKGGGKK